MKVRHTLCNWHCGGRGSVIAGVHPAAAIHDGGTADAGGRVRWNLLLHGVIYLLMTLLLLLLLLLLFSHQHGLLPRRGVGGKIPRVTKIIWP